MKNLNRGFIVFLLCFYFAGCSSFAVRKHAADKYKSIILIGWDGTQRDRLNKLLAEGKLPNLKLLIAQGSLLDLDIVKSDTSTKAGWAEILSGYSPAITGVYNNREKYKPIPKGYTIFERLEEYFGDSNITTVFLAGKKHNLGSRGPHRVWPKGPRGKWWNEDAWAEFMPPQKDILDMEGEPYMLTRSNVDFFENGLGKAGEVGRKLADYIARFKDDRFFIFAQFEEPDELGHAYGENSIGYAKGLIMDDAWLGKTVALLKKLKIYDTTLIYVVSDHGFTHNSKEHDYAPWTFLASNDRGIKKDRAERKDVTPTLLRRYGVNIRKIKPPLEGRPLN